MKQKPSRSHLPAVREQFWEKAGFAASRILALIAVAAVFYPGLNPGRVTEAISRNVSLFTQAVS